VLTLPDDAHPVALIPVGFPAGRFGPNNRKPVESVVHWEHWGAQRDRAPSPQ
jgi:nitroreductase